MLKKSTTNKQLGLFTTASSLMCKRESKQYEDEKEWHMQFYRNFTCNIDEDVFRPLFDEKMGCPTKAIRQLVAMSILKEGAGCSDETLYENYRYNLLWRAALGLFKISIKTKEGKDTYRYFDKTCIERSKVRRQTESIPWDERKKRNNVEASIFQYSFHTRNNKTRYRGLIKHTLQTIARCAWINMRRLFLYDIERSLQIA